MTTPQQAYDAVVEALDNAETVLAGVSIGQATLVDVGLGLANALSLLPALMPAGEVDIEAAKMEMASYSVGVHLADQELDQLAKACAAGWGLTPKVSNSTGLEPSLSASEQPA